MLTLLGGILCYFLGNTICIRNFHVTLLDYQGINDMADVTVKSLIGSVKNCIYWFFTTYIRGVLWHFKSKSGSHSLSGSLPYGWSVSA